MFRMVQGWGKTNEDDAVEASRYASAALERDRRDAVALAIHGHMLSATRRDYDGAMDFLDRAVQAGPSCHMAWTLSSATLAWRGDGQRAVEHATIAMRLSPLDPFAFFAESMLSLAYYVSEDYEQAVLWGRRSAAHNAMHTSNLRTLVGALVAVGDLEGARRVARQVRVADPGFNLAKFATRTPISEKILKAHLPRLRIAGLGE
jgi:tetratricopeptide (TPR) repeat protein